MNPWGPAAQPQVAFGLSQPVEMLLGGWGGGVGWGVVDDIIFHNPSAHRAVLSPLVFMASGGRRSMERFAVVPVGHCFLLASWTTLPKGP